MPQINVATPFRLQSIGPDRQPVFKDFAAGIHEVDEATANHPYVKANLVDGHTQALPVPGTPQAQLLVRQAADAASAAVARVLQAAHGRVGEDASAAVEAALRGEAPVQGPTLQDVLSAVSDVGNMVTGLNARVAELEARAAAPAPAPVTAPAADASSDSAGGSGTKRKA